jgi:hypothetical protein
MKIDKDTTKKVTVGVILGSGVTALSLYLLTKRDPLDNQVVIEAIEVAREDVKMKVIAALKNDFQVGSKFVNVKPEITKLARDVMSYLHPRMR